MECVRIFLDVPTEGVPSIKWRCHPEPKFIQFGLSLDDGRPFVVFQGGVKGSFSLCVGSYHDDETHLEQYVINTGTPDDVTPPDPDDEDDDPPLPPQDKWQVVIVYESNDLDNMPSKQRLMITGLAFREKVAAAGHFIVKGGITDQHIIDASGKAPSSLAPFLAACKGKPLPRICIAPITSGTIQTFPLPADETATLNLLKGASCDRCNNN
jgi:hypothetical protein